MADVIIYQHDEYTGPPVRLSSPEGRVLSPEVLKRIIEGHEASDTFDEGINISVKDNDRNSTNLAKEIAHFARK